MFVKTNVVGTQTLLNAAKEHGIHKFIQVSTDEVYGSLGTSGYFTELSPLAPNSPYSASKAGLIYLLVLTMKHMDLMSTLQDVRTTMDRITFQKN